MIPREVSIGQSAISHGRLFLGLAAEMPLLRTATDFGNVTQFIGFL
jgi:hypothetical protein